jgi:hypothetical protein
MTLIRQCPNCHREYDYHTQGAVCPHRLRTDGGIDTMQSKAVINRQARLSGPGCLPKLWPPDRQGHPGAGRRGIRSAARPDLSQHALAGAPVRAGQRRADCQGGWRGIRSTKEVNWPAFANRNHGAAMKWTRKRIAALYRRHKAGFQLKEIGSAERISGERVRQLFNRERFPTRPWHAHIDRIEARELYEAGWTLHQIADRMGVDHTGVYYALRRSGTRFRPAGMAKGAKWPVESKAQRPRALAILLSELCRLHGGRATATRAGISQATMYRILRKWRGAIDETETERKGIPRHNSSQPETT